MRSLSSTLLPAALLAASLAGAPPPPAAAACGSGAPLAPTDTAARIVYLSLADPLPNARSAARAWAENSLQSVALHLRPPATLTVPALASYPYSVAPGRAGADGPGLSGTVLTTMGSDGRIGVVALTEATGAAELDEALLGAVAAADSAGDLPPLPPRSRGGGILRVRLQTARPGDRASIPLFRVRLPFARAALPPEPASHLDGPAPRYPTRARDAGVTGAALAQFVIATLGRARMPTLRCLELADPSFGDAVRAVLPQWKFVPARVNGCVTAQLVQMPFQFSLRGPARPVAVDAGPPFPPPLGGAGSRWPR